MKKILLGIIGLLIIAFLVIIAIRIFTPEDTWICQNGQWVKNGNPRSSMPNKSCIKEGEKTPTPTAGNAGIANPASVSCEQKGGKLEIRKETAGELGICKFSDGTECEEWQFFRNDCFKGQYKSADTSHSYSGVITKTKSGYTFKDESGVSYSLTVPAGASKALTERLNTEVTNKETVVIVASENPPLSRTLILKSFQEK